MEIIYEIDGYCVAGTYTHLDEDDKNIYVYFYEYDENGKKRYDDYKKVFKPEERNKVEKFCNFVYNVKSKLKEKQEFQAQFEDKWGYPEE